MAEIAPTDEKVAACSHEWVKRSYECTTSQVCKSMRRRSPPPPPCFNTTKPCVWLRNALSLFQENEKLYDEWAKVYDSTMDPKTYRAPFGVLEHVQKNELMGKSAKILDVGCGTGGAQV